MMASRVPKPVPKSSTTARFLPLPIFSRRDRLRVRSRTQRLPGTSPETGRPFPTVGRTEPEQWRLPIWLAVVPTGVVVFAVGGLGLTASWGWAIDARNAGIVGRRLTLAEPSRVPLPEWVKPGSSSWWATNAVRQVHWSAYLDRQSGDPETAEDARRLLDDAGLGAPLNPTRAIRPGSRLARRLEPALARPGRLPRAGTSSR